MCGRFAPCSGLLSLVSSPKLPLAKFGLKQDRRPSFWFKFYSKSGL